MSRSILALATYLAACATCVVCTTTAAAQGDVAVGDESEAEHALATLHSAVQQARFEEARTRAQAFLERPGLSARHRNEALELLAVAQIAARDQSAAQTTLRALFARDPEHAERLRDPGPTVSASFARARAVRPAPLVPRLTTALFRDASGRILLRVRLGDGRDALDSVHVFTHAPPSLDRAHLVADVGTKGELTFALPTTPSAQRSKLELYVEARAPSGALLARVGSADAPRRLTLPASPLRCEPACAPVRRAWWLWTSVAIVVASIAVSGAIVAN